MRKLEVVPYNPAWPELFQLEKEKLASVLSNEVIAIHHIGSTSVPSLSSKPIIDILIEVKSIENIDRYNNDLATIGYDAKGENGIARRRFFQKGGDERTHHVHVFQAHDKNILRHLAFRDYLIAHPETSAAYATLKQQLVNQNPDIIDAYIEGKNDFVKEIERRALEWVKTI